MHIIDVAVLYPHCPIGLDRHHQKDTDSLRCAGVFQGLSSRFFFFCVCVFFAYYSSVFARFLA